MLKVDFPAMVINFDLKRVFWGSKSHLIFLKKFEPSLQMILKIYLIDFDFNDFRTRPRP